MAEAAFTLTMTAAPPPPGGVPEPGALVLLGAGLVGALPLLRRRRG